MKYALIVNSRATTFARHVTEHINDGWKLQGGASWQPAADGYKGAYIQAVVKDE